MPRLAAPASPVLDKMRERGISSLIRIPGLPPSEAWQGHGDPELKLSHREVVEAGAAGALSIQGNRAKIAARVTKATNHANRSEAAKKAAETRRLQPLGPAAMSALKRLDTEDGFYQPTSTREYAACQELLRKGMAMRATFRGFGGGRVNAFAITGHGRAFLAQGDR